jgi:hypothetical protein
VYANRVLVLAGTYQQFDLRRRIEMGLPEGKLVYVRDANHIRGWARETRYIVVGTFYDRRDASAILAVVHSQEYRLVESPSQIDEIRREAELERPPNRRG